MAFSTDSQSGPSNTKSRPQIRPRFTLAALLALVTLSALAAWYWWRVPFEVEVKRSGNRAVETVRRLWGGKTLRHGPLYEFDKDGHKIAELPYREGMLHGPSQWFDSQERPVLVLNFERGKLVEPLPTDVEPGIARRLVEGKTADDLLTETLLQTAPIHFDCPFKDGMEFLEAQHGYPIEIDAQNLEENGISIDTPVSIKETRLPLIATLGRILKPLKLTCDYRYGVLFITTPENFEAGDQTGISDIKPPKDSLLAQVWDVPVEAEFLETPLARALGHLAEQTKGRFRFDLSQLPAGTENIPITRTLNLPLRHVFAAISDEHSWRCELEDETIVFKLREQRNSPSESDSQ